MDAFYAPEVTEPRLSGPDDPTALGADATPRAPAPVAALAPGRIAGYELLEVLGRGGAGVVHRARHLALGKVVALKLLEGGSQGEVARFVQEARAMASLDHPHVLRVHDVGEEAGRWFIVMDLAPGGTCSALVRSTSAAEGPRVPLARALELVEKVARGVAHAHERGIIHRDLKPSNVLLTSAGEPLVADFGLARRRDVPAGITASGDVLGTPAYMAPEQARGEPVDERADVYALGAIAYELLAGVPPVAATGMLARDLIAAATSEPVPLRRRVPGLPVDVETVVHRALAREPGERYPSAAALAEDVARLRRGAPVEARRPSFVLRASRWARRRRSTVIAASALALAGLAAVQLARERLADRRAWEVASGRGGPVASLDGWQVLDGTWTVEGGELRGVGRPARLALATPIEGDVRVEYTARLLPLAGRAGGDLSVELLPRASSDEDSGYFFGFGSGGDAFSKLARQGRRVAVLEGEAARAGAGKPHRVRAEREGPRLALEVDGKLLLEHRDLVPLDLGGGARVVLYSWDADARFSDVVVSRRSPARRPRRSEVADGLLARGEPAAAALLYAEAARDADLAPDERRELELKGALAEIEAAAASDPAPGDRLGRAASVLEPIAREPGASELGLEAAVGLAEVELLRGTLEAAFARARAAAATPLPTARDAVRELYARAEARLLARAHHEARLSVLRETAALFATDPHVEFEVRVAEAASLVALARVAEAEAVLAAALARLGEDAFFGPELLLELAATRRRRGDLGGAGEALARCLERARLGSPEQERRVLIEVAALALDRGDGGAARGALERSRALGAAGPSHEAIVAALEAELALATASPERRAALVESLERTTRPAPTGRANEAARIWGARAALAAAVARVASGDEAGARAGLGASVEGAASLSIPEVTALLTLAVLEERGHAPEAARRTLERVAAGCARTPHLSAVARALASGSVSPDGARRLLETTGDARGDRAVAALALGGCARGRGEPGLDAVLAEAADAAAPAAVRGLAASIARNP